MLDQFNFAQLLQVSGVMWASSFLSLSFSLFLSLYTLPNCQGENNPHSVWQLQCSLQEEGFEVFQSLGVNQGHRQAKPFKS